MKYFISEILILQKLFDIGFLCILFLALFRIILNCATTKQAQTGISPTARFIIVISVYLCSNIEGKDPDLLLDKKEVLLPYHAKPCRALYAMSVPCHTCCTL